LDAAKGSIGRGVTKSADTLPGRWRTAGGVTHAGVGVLFSASRRPPARRRPARSSEFTRSARARAPRGRRRRLRVRSARVRSGATTPRASGRESLARPLRSRFGPAGTGAFRRARAPGAARRRAAARYDLRPWRRPRARAGEERPVRRLRRGSRMSTRGGRGATPPPPGGRPRSGPRLSMSSPRRHPYCPPPPAYVLVVFEDGGGGVAEAPRVGGSLPVDRDFSSEHMHPVTDGAAPSSRTADAAAAVGNRLRQPATVL
jgi:hypothetical protein